MTDDDVLLKAKLIAKKRIIGEQILLSSPEETARYICPRIGNEEKEIFLVLYLSRRHKVIACEELFAGTIDGCSVYPREVVKRVLFFNGAAVVVAHNHPSGELVASTADREITRRLSDALGLIGVTLLDHLIVTGSDFMSFAQRGYL